MGVSRTHNFISRAICSAAVASSVALASSTTALAASAPSPVQPQVQVLIAPGPMGHDLVGLTYPGLVKRTQAQGDVDAISRNATLAPVGLQFSDSALPLKGIKSVPMTSATFMADGALPAVGSNTLKIEPWIDALHNYNDIAITFMMPPQFAFTGLRTFTNSKVDIALNQRESTYTYRIHIKDHNFTSLGLPAAQLNPAAQRVADSDEHRERLRLIGLALVSALAVAVGFSVYAFLTRLS